MRIVIFSIATAALFAGCPEPTVPDDDSGIIYIDVDGDGSPSEFDCDDNNPINYPGNVEICDGVDNNCNGVIDDNPANAIAWYADVDGDLYGDPVDPDLVCHDEAVLNRVLNDLDCDDENPDRNPGMDEICDGFDNDCDLLVDEDLPPDAPKFYYDFDGDGFGNKTTEVVACFGPSGYVENGDDCNDINADVHPDAKENCATPWDDNCNGNTNDQDSTGCTDYHFDADGDGYGVNGNDGCFCQAWGSFSAENTDDCDDTSAGAHPGGEELCGDGVDQDCSGADAECEIIELANADHKFVGEGSQDNAGASVADAGDVNGDGISDIIIGAPHNASSWSSGPGDAYIVFGPPTSASLDLSLADIKLTGVDNGDWLGAWVSGAGDVNGDDIDDVIIGAPGVSKTFDSAGAAYLVLGPLEKDISVADADAHFMGEWTSDGAGSVVAGVGDIDDDGMDDFIVTSFIHGSPPQAGTVYLIHGPSPGNLLLKDIDDRIVGENYGDHVGFSADGAGDLDGDGLPDLIIGAPNDDQKDTDAGAAYIALGPVSGEIPVSITDAKLRGQAANDRAGSSVAGVGDIDGDGLDDVLIGADGEATAGTNSGAAYLITDSVIESKSLKKADAKLISEASHHSVGWAVAGAGDFNGDGFDDLLLGAPIAPYNTIVGATYLVYGPVDGTFDLADTDFKLVGNSLEAHPRDAVPGGHGRGRHRRCPERVGERIRQQLPGPGQG
ncbi:MAG: hypothetical protein HN348_19770, partial [Proteobacteria bacterium]|nr:hypothetical protein [Pseudomonadota bacterium]